MFNFWRRLRVWWAWRWIRHHERYELEDPEWFL